MSLQDGISVIVCCHNSASRLHPTLEHLKRQAVPGGLSWEVIVVDNASTDNTAQVAAEAWGESGPAPLRVIREGRLGKMHGFRLGCEEARHEIMAFLDDDNWVAPDWVAIAYGVMLEHPDAGICGGFIEPVFEVPPPDWFGRVQENYAIGPQGEGRGAEIQDVTSTRGFLWGAGMILRKSDWSELVRRGFRSRLTCRRGKEMSAGGDTEVCFAMRMAGRKLLYDPRLRLKHFIPAGRLSWTHARKLFRGFGKSWVVFEAYRLADEFALNSPGQRATKRLWLRQMLSWLGRMNALRGPLVRVFVAGADEGSQSILDAEAQIGFLLGLLQWRGTFEVLVAELRDAGWRKTPPIHKP